MKYTQNLKVVGNKVYSYDTHVATIAGGQLLVHGWWSKTTSKHVNHVADVYRLTVNKDAPIVADDVKSKDDGLKTLGMVMAMQKLFAPDKKTANDWNLRVMKAGIPEGALNMPEEWDQLPEEEKERRLDGVIKTFTEK